MKRCAIYTRYSTELQSDRSIDDQIAVCRAYAARNALEVIAIYADHAASGASLHGRKEMARLLADAKARRFDVLLSETLSRIGRDEEDRAAIRKRLAFVDVAIMTTVDGLVTRLTDGIKAVIDGQQLEDLKVMVRRGMAGVVRDGRHAGGLAYGYMPVAGRTGALAIRDGEAAIVRRIFNEYAEGLTPRAIAIGLNRDGIAAPRSSAWNASTINGWGARGAGILNNRLYAGEIVWNKNRMVKDPDTGKRVSRANPETEWHIAPVPALALISAELFAKVRARRRARATTMPHMQRAPRHLFSGLLRCGACGGGMSSFGADRSGRRRIRCTASTERGTCPAPRTFYLDAVETLVLDTLKAELRHPEVIAEYVRTYHAERERLAANRGKARSRIVRRLAAIDREAERCIDGIVKGIGNTDRLGIRSKELAVEQADCERALAALPDVEQPVALHPAVLQRYERQIANLQAVVSASVQRGESEAAPILRDLIESIVVHATGKPGAVKIEIIGRLRALLGDKAFPTSSAVCGSLVAGGRCGHSTPMFRLAASA